MPARKRRTSSKHLVQHDPGCVHVDGGGGVVVVGELGSHVLRCADESCSLRQRAAVRDPRDSEIRELRG